jgi:hypothetical protein
MKKCTVCGTAIPEGRLKAVPNAVTCTEHSNASRFGVNVVQHGNIEQDGFQEIEVVRDQRALEQLNHYKDQLGKYQ